MALYAKGSYFSLTQSLKKKNKKRKEKIFTSEYNSLCLKYFSIFASLEEFNLYLNRL